LRLERQAYAESLCIDVNIVAEVLWGRVIKSKGNKMVQPQEPLILIF